MTRRLVHLLQPLALLLAALFIFLLLSRHWHELREFQWRIRPRWLLLSAATMFMAWLLEVWIWQQVLAQLGGRLPYWSAWRIWFLSAVVRYIPGNVWQPLSMTLYCRRQGIQPEQTLLSALFYQLVTLYAVLPTVAFYWAWNGGPPRSGLTLSGLTTPWLIGFAILPLLVVLWKPEWLVYLVNRMLRTVGRPQMPYLLISGRVIMLLVTAALLTWLLWGLSFTTLAIALVGLDDSLRQSAIVHLILSYPLAYAIGFVSLITPSGIGVREGAFYLLLTPLVPGAVVTISSLAMRLWTILGEVTLAGISAIIHNGTTVHSSANSAGD